jgi:hypothetical protein
MRSIASTAALVFALASGTLGAVLPRVALATPSLDACTGVLHHVPGSTATIMVETPGTWCLDADMVESVDVVDTYFAMISVSSDDVTIDCRGYRIQYSGTASSMYGIGTLGQRQRVVVRNCTLLGFSTAISVAGDGFVIEDNEVLASVPPGFLSGKAIDGYGNGVIRRNRVRDSINIAIGTMGSTQVLDNIIDGVSASANASQAYAIDIFNAAGAEVRGNSVRGLVSSFPNQMIAMNINGSSGDTRTLVRDNVLVHDGSMGPIGVMCSGSSARVVDNVISGFFAPLVFDCVDAGDNDISP